MKTRSGFTDDDGQTWEFTYEEKFQWATEEDGETLVKGEDGFPIMVPSIIVDFRYRKIDEEEWHSLPSWADVRDEWKINLCFFDEDEETDEMTFWVVSS